jgi:23S rRNA (cytosine1962-C5)-methyltransferase
VIQDPPPFSRSRHGVFQAEKHYPVLAADSLSLVAPGGYAALSCGAAGLARATFYRYLAEAAQAAGVKCVLVSRGRVGADFPALENFPEGQHQKFALIHVEGPAAKGELTGLEACV